MFFSTVFLLLLVNGSLFLTRLFLCCFFSTIFGFLTGVEQLFPHSTTDEVRRRRHFDHVGVPHRGAAHETRPQGQVRPAKNPLSGWIECCPAGAG